MKRLLALAAMTMLGVALTAPAAMADDSIHRHRPRSAQEKVSAYVQPSVVYLQMKWTGYVCDTFLKEYINGGKPFVVRHPVHRLRRQSQRLHRHRRALRGPQG